MKRFLMTHVASLALAGAAAAQSPYIDPHYRPPIGGPVDPPVFSGARYSFYQPSFYSSSYYQPSYTQPTFYTPKYLQPGPYWYTPAHSFTPGYYSYYYTPGYFRY
jgi:hypothetical protein